MTPEQLELMQQFRDASTQLRNSAEQSLGKILDKKQASRLKQIQLQLEGPWVVLRDDMIEKLNMSEEQVEMLREIRNGQRQKQREVQKNGREAFNAVMQKINPEFGKNGGFGRGNRGNRGNAGGGQNGGGAQNGDQGNRPQFDQAAFQKMRDEMQKMMDNPEVKDQREKQREMEKAVEDESYAIITKNLYPRQRTTLKNMVGAPFDRSVLGGPFAGRFGGAAAAKNGTAKGNTAAKATSEDDEEEASAAAATAKPQAPAKAKAAAPKRKSLRELRNGGDDE